MSRNKEHIRRPPHWGRLCVLRFCSCIFYIMNIYGYSLDIPYIFHIYIYTYIYIHIYVLNIFHLFSCVCSVIYSVNSRSGHDRSQTFGSISHISGPNLTFAGKFIMVLHGFASRNRTTHSSHQKTLK